MDKVYLVIIDDVCDFECTSKFKIFKNPDDAKKYFDNVVAAFKRGTKVNSDRSIIEGDESKGMFTWYEDGFYNENHYEVLLVEKEVY